MNQIDRKTASKRASEIQKLHLQISLKNFKKYEEKTIEVFVNEQKGSNCLARDENYRLVVIRTNNNLLGRKVKVRVKQTFSHYLLAEMI